MANDFNVNKAVGDVGEDFTLQFLENQYKDRYADLRKDITCRMNDVDWAYINNNGRMILFDTKTDQTFCPDQGRKNIPFKLTTGQKLGDPLYSQADFYYFLSMESKEGLWINLKMWNDWIRQHRHDYSIVSFDVLGGGEGILCPMDRLISDGVADQHQPINIDRAYNNIMIHDYVSRTFFSAKSTVINDLF